MFKMEKDNLGNAVRTVGDWLPETGSLITMCERKKSPNKSQQEYKQNRQSLHTAEESVEGRMNRNLQSLLDSS